MPDFIITAYPWFKALHILSVMFWMGAQMLLPILLAVHHEHPLASPQAVLLLRIERQLISRIMNPAMLAAFVLGILLASVLITAAEQLPNWLGLKLGLVFVLSALHGKLLQQFRCISEGRAPWSARAYCFLQRLNVLLLTGIVGLVVLKPVLAQP